MHARLSCLQRKLPSPGFQVEVVLVDYDAAAVSARPPSGSPSESAGNSGANTASRPSPGPIEVAAAATAKNSKKDKDDEFSDSEAEESVSSKSRQTGISSQGSGTVTANNAVSHNNNDSSQIANLTRKTEQVSLGTSPSTHTELKKEAVGGSGTELSTSVGEVSEFKAVAADASVFSFGDDEDYESE